MLTKPEAVAALSLSVQTEFARYGLDGQEIYVNCNIKAPECPEEQRKPVDMVIVLDCSGSMAEANKLGLCKDTIQFLMKAVSSKDRLSLITYDSDVKTRLPLTKMDGQGQKMLRRALEIVRPGTMTNLSGGLLEGIAQVQNTTREKGEPNPVQSVLLLTDGLANQGITNTTSLVNMVQDVLRPDVSLFAFGYGSGNHNSDLLRSLSDVGNGVYYLVDNVDSIALAFADCLGGLLSVVAQNLKVECIASHECTIEEIKTSKKIETKIEKVHYLLNMGDMYGEEERDLLLRVKLPEMGMGEENLQVLKFVVTYANIVASTLDRLEGSAVLSRSQETGKCEPNAHVVKQKMRILAVEALETAKKAGDLGRLEEGRECIRKTRAKLSAMGPEEIGYSAQLDDCMYHLTSQATYERVGRNHFTSTHQAHCAQRSNGLGLVAPEVPQGQAMGGLAWPMINPSPMCFKGAYRSSKKSAMMAKAEASMDDKNKK